GVVAQAPEGTLRDGRVALDEPADLGDGDARGPLQGEAERAGADGGEGDGLQAVPHRQSQAVAVTARQLLVLARTAAVPDRADRVDDVAGGEMIAFCDLGFARCAAGAGRGPRPERPAPPPSREVFAALTIASTGSLVMSPWMISIRSDIRLLLF